MRTLCSGPRMLAVALAAMLFCSPALADLSAKVSAVKTVQTITPEIVTQMVAEDGTPIGAPVKEVGEPVVHEGQPAALLTITSDRDLSDGSNVLVRVKCKTGKATTLEPGAYLFNEPGTHAVDIMVLGQNPLSLDEESVEVVIGTPVPPVPPTPDVPADRFENIGQRVAIWTTGATFTGNARVAAIFKAHEAMLRADPSQTINSVSESLSRSLTALPEAAAYIDVRKAITADLAQRWSRDRLGRIDLADYYACVALGLGGVN